jgi:uncharacterized coiled-coil DUF342 family protein
MGSSQPSEEVTVSADGITVVKRFEEDEFPVPAIAFEFRSARDEPVTVRLRDAVPDGVAVEDLGFHPEYGSEYWTVDDGAVSFERELGAGTEYTTVYGIRATGEDIERFLVEPTIEAVDPPLPDTGGADEHADTQEVDVVPGDQDAVKEAIAGEGAVPGLEDEGGDGADTEDETEPLDLEEPTAGTDDEETASGAGEEAEAAADEPDEEVEAAATADTRIKEGTEDEQGEEPEPAIREVAAGEAAAQPVDGGLLAALAEEIRSDDVDEEDLELLRDTVEATGTVDGSTEARIRQLQRDVADLRAYTDALDEFLDENGTAQQVLEDAREQIDSFEDKLAEFGETVERVESDAAEATATARETEEAVGTLRDEVDGVHENVEDVGEDIDDVEADVEDVEEDLEGVQTEVGEVQTDVDDLAAGVDDVRGEVEKLQVDMDGASASIADLEDRTATFEEELEEVKSEVHEGDLEGRIEEMESTLQDLQEWQTQIKETFGGG